METKTIKNGGKSFPISYGLVRPIEVIQHNVGKFIPEEMETLEDRSYNYAQFDFFAPQPVVEEAMRLGRITKNNRKKVFTIKTPDQKKYKVIFDDFGL